MNISELVKAAHSNAVEKGWWEKERTYGESIGLVHSEISEALEDYRDGKGYTEVWYEAKNYDGQAVTFSEQKYPEWKPCGIPSELADVCIRIFDIAGKYGWGEEIEKKYNHWITKKIVDDFTIRSFPGQLTVLHYHLSKSWEGHETGNTNEEIGWLSECLITTSFIAKQYGIDLDQAITEKMAYNATRTHRHGGKVL